MYYVKMIDKFLSGWGKAKGKEAMYIYECGTAEEAEIVADNAKHHKDQTRVSITSGKPKPNYNKYYVVWCCKNDDNSWWYTPRAYENK